MQYISYIPVDYRDGRPNGDSSFNWTGNEGYGDERAYDFRLQPISMDRCRSHNKSMVCWIMQKHEATFRLQVQELHRLYGKQRELMEEMKMGQNFLCSRISDSPGMNPSVLQEMSSIHGLRLWSQFSEPTTRNALRSAVTFEDPASSSNGKMFNLELLLSGQHDQRGKTMEDLLQIVDLHKVKVQADLCDSKERRTDFSIDLNQPIQLDIDPPVSSSVVPYDSSEALVSEKSGVINSDDSNLVTDFDLNSLPSSSFSGEETTPEMNDSHKMPVMDSKNSHRISGTILEIDLNSTILVEEPSELAISTKDTDYMYPISPENQEASPPRCESEDIGQDLPTDHDLLAARTLVTMFDDNNCLRWFAEIVSSAGDDPKNENELKSNKKRKSAGKQVDHRASGRIEKRFKPKEKVSFSKGNTSSALKQSWGKTGKREGGCRRRRVV